MANLVAKFGVMGSSKSMHLIAEANNYDRLGRDILVLKPGYTRDTEVIKSRIGTSHKCIKFEKDTSLLQLILDNQKDKHISCIMIDESQQLTSAQVLELCSIVDYGKIDVICYGLMHDYKGNMFEGSNMLNALANKKEWYKTLCEFCSSSAILNIRVEGSDEQIDHEAEYKSVCRKCWLEHSLDIDIDYKEFKGE